MARVISSSTTATTYLDTNIYNTITSDGSQPLKASLGTKSKKSAGIVKLANMFLKLLYTIKGSNYLDKNEGTAFVRIFDMATSDEDALVSRVHMAVEDAAGQIEYNQSLYEVPTDERLKRAYISAFSVTQDGKGNNNINMAIGLEVESGLTTQVQLPSTIEFG